MASAHENDGAGPLRQRTERFGATQGNLRALDEVRRSAKGPSDEASPLLGQSGGSSGDGTNGPAVPEWEGKADYDGLPWWQRPSVRSAYPIDRVARTDVE
jgi:hypothetical protein